MKRIVLWCAIFCFAVCGSGLHAVAADTAGKESVTVMLDWFINPDFAPLIIAKEKGFFAKHGLEVEIMEPADPNDPPKLAAAGKIDLAVTSQPLQLLHIDNGLPLVRIATLVPVPLNTVMVLKDSGISEIKQLAGKKVGYSIGGFETLLLNTMLKEDGLGADDVETVNVNFSITPSLLTGKVDAVIGGYPPFELNQLELEGKKGLVFNVEEYGVPVYDELILVTNKKNIADQKQAKVLRRFVDALDEAARYLVKHPAESWQLFVRTNPADLDNELNRLAWRDFLPLFALRPGALDRARYLRLARFFKENGMIKNIPPLEDFAVELP